MGKYLFISVFALSLILAAWGNQYKMQARMTPIDTIGAACSGLRPFATSRGILYYRTDGSQQAVDGLIRTRFALAPIVLLPASGQDTVLQVGAGRCVCTGSLWQYSDARLCLSLTVSPTR